MVMGSGKTSKTTGGQGTLQAARLPRYGCKMPNRSGKRPADLNRLAASLVDDATDETPEPDGESPHARAGRLGGLNGGKARANKLSPGERSEIARRAARARWGSG